MIIRLVDHDKIEFSFEPKYEEKHYLIVVSCIENVLKVSKSNAPEAIENSIISHYGPLILREKNKWISSINEDPNTDIILGNEDVIICATNEFNSNSIKKFKTVLTAEKSGLNQSSYAHFIRNRYRAGREKIFVRFYESSVGNSLPTFYTLFMYENIVILEPIAEGNATYVIERTVAAPDWENCSNEILKDILSHEEWFSSIREYQLLDMRKLDGVHSVIHRGFNKWQIHLYKVIDRLERVGSFTLARHPQ